MTLEESLLNQELGNVDLSKISALQQKRTIAFINHFVLTNVQFMNNFLKKCEQNLMNFERKLEKVNAAMVLLETRLSSIPELSTNTTATPTDAVPSKPLDASATRSSDSDATKPSEDTIELPPKNNSKQVEVPTEVAEAVLENKQASPEYEKFLKMVHVGVPLPAVKLKLSQEGLDPNVLDELLSK